MLLKEAMKLVKTHGYIVGNVDSTIIAQAPKMAPHIASMTANIASDLDVSVSQVSVKAKTNAVSYTHLFLFIGFSLLTLIG